MCECCAQSCTDGALCICCIRIGPTRKNHKLELPPVVVAPADKTTDLKAGVGKKAPLAQVPKILDVYSSRAHQFGAFKYKIGNYMRPPAEGVSDVERLLEYISAAKRHLGDWADEITRYLGGGLRAKETLELACYAPDAESGLPHACHAAATLGMALQQAADAGLMPPDPGKTWSEVKSAA